MLKFETPETPLEVVRWSEHRPAFLNRQIVVLLSSLGLPDKALEEMQNNMLESLSLALESPQAAAQMLCNVPAAAARRGDGGDPGCLDWPRMMVYSR